MGKLGVVGLTLAAVVVAALLPSREAGAQDFGQSWIDRITHELEQERGPLQPKPVTYNVDTGVNYAFDNNIFLTKTDKKSDSIIIPFVQASIAYAEPRFDLEARLLADYKFYAKEDADDDEERVFLRARQTSSRWNFEISEIFQNVSDPAGLLFIDRVSRVVSNTIPKVAFDIGRSWAAEVGANIQIVRFEDKAFNPQENNNFSVDFSVIYRTPWAFDVLGQFGYFNINYLEDQVTGGAPDAFGYYYRLGYRGHVVERLYLEALVGYTTVETDFFVATGNDLKEGTLSAIVNLRYELTERMNLFVDASRGYAFQGFGDPYQLLNQVTVYLSMEFTEQFTMALRAQYDKSDSALNVKRSYYGAGLTGTYKITSHFIADAGVTIRGGKTEDAFGNELKFTDFILSAGIAYSW